MTDWLRTFNRVATTWAPKSVETLDVVGTDAPAIFAAILDQPSPVADEGDPLPPLWHWFLHLPVHPQAALGDDGHPRTDALLPPLPGDRRRMFGGGRLEVSSPLRVGDRVVRTSKVTSRRVREGTSGPLLLTTVRHTFVVEGDVRIVEEQDIVYLPPHGRSSAGDGTDGADRVAPATAKGVSWSLEFATDPIVLFRFSALTANAHRIHYDRTFAQQVEGHPDLVVHGPLSALLLLELPRRHAPSMRVHRFDWRARRPAFVGQRLVATGTIDRDVAALALSAGSALRTVVGTTTLVDPPFQASL